MPRSSLMLPALVYRALAGISSEWGGHGFACPGHPVAVASGLKALGFHEHDRALEPATCAGEQCRKQRRTFGDYPRFGAARGKGPGDGCELVADNRAASRVSRRQ